MQEGVRLAVRDTAVPRLHTFLPTAAVRHSICEKVVGLGGGGGGGGGGAGAARHSSQPPGLKITCRYCKPTAGTEQDKSHITHMRFCIREIISVYGNAIYSR